METINIVGAGFTMLMGMLGLLAPAKAAQLTGLEGVTGPGRSEFRATFGGAFF